MTYNNLTNQASACAKIISHPETISEGFRIRASESNEPTQPTLYKNVTAPRMAELIIGKLYNGKYISASEDPRLSQCWLRDLAWVSRALVEMGPEYKEMLKNSTLFLLENFTREGVRQSIYTAVNKEGIPLQVFDYPVDGLYSVLTILKDLNEPNIVNQYDEFLKKELYKLIELFNNGFINFSRPKDTIINVSSPILNAFLCKTIQLAIELLGITKKEKLDLEVLYQQISASMWEEFWDNERKMFFEIQSGEEKVFSSDASLLPFYLEIKPTDISNEDYLDNLRDMLTNFMGAGFYENGLIRFHLKGHKPLQHPATKVFLDGYQGESLWSMDVPKLILLNIKASRFKEAREILNEHTKWVLQMGNYYEVMESEDPEKPFRGNFNNGSSYGLIWVANLNYLTNKFSEICLIQNWRNLMVFLNHFLLNQTEK